MSSAPLQRTADWLLTRDEHQRMRLLQCFTAFLLMLATGLGLHYLVWAEIAPAAPAGWWTLLTLLAFAGFLAFIRSGRNLHFEDPSLTVAQMLVAYLCVIAAYAMAGAGRGAVIPILMVILMFGMYSLQPLTVHLVALLAVLLVGVTMAAMAWLQPAVYDPKVEIGHFAMVGTMLAAVSLLAGQLSQLRERLRQQRIDLALALERIQDLATRDELTGLVNRRHMQEVLQLEHQRCMRSGHPFCVAMIDLDHFKRINDTHGHPVGDEVLRTFAREALAAIRVSDVLARWGGEEFLLLVSDTRGPLARLGVERLRERTAALRVNVNGAPPLQFTLSAGVTEHLAGETLAETVARADRALYAAKAGGRNKVMLH